MKHNIKTIILTVLQYIVLIAPTAAYAIYTYQQTLQYTMTAQSKGCFWALVAAAILGAIVYGIFRKRYDRYVQGFVQQKTDLETNPGNELLIKKVAEKKVIIENIDYLVALIPVLIAITIVAAFQTAIEQLLILLCVVAGSLAAKIALHLLTTAVQKRDMLKKCNKNKEDEYVRQG